jgi:hypothetical protein
VLIKTNRSDKTEIKKKLKISGHQQRRPRPLPEAILIPPALLVVADFLHRFYSENLVSGVRFRLSEKVDAIAYPEH